MTADSNRKEICKVGCCCCDMGCIQPSKICKFSGHCLCSYSVASCSCCDEEYVPFPVCALCFWQCCPGCGFCVAPPSCPALDQTPQPQVMDRGLPSLRVRLLVEEAQPVSVVTPVMEQVVSVRVCTRTETKTVAQIRNGFVTEQRQTEGVPGQIRSGFVTAQCEKGVATGQIRNGFVTEQDQKGAEPGQIRSGFVTEHRQKGVVPGRIRNATEQDQKGAGQGQIQSGFVTEQRQKGVIPGRIRKGIVTEQCRRGKR
jgi:hypothetical protein